ncbi:DUF4419 domain-containing protein [Deinococcus misasensis]|uniref:DUF4419 domain-containing protein n=1 Tax=Deinococcus misasensis TaxID=392413 RepID=UPI0006920000|nr:DUF4419 domain-containing protein [Deinococcus misasensis]
METLPHHHSRLARQALEALQTLPTPEAWRVSLLVETPGVSLERFDLSTSSEEGFWRRVWWDRTGDTERMEAYHHTLEGIEKLREKHKPRLWDIALHEENGTTPIEVAQPLLESTTHLPEGLIKEVTAEGIRMTLTLHSGGTFCWLQGNQPSLDQWATHFQSLVQEAVMGGTLNASISNTGVCFQVDDVEPATVLLQHQPLHNQLARQLKVELLCSSFDDQQQVLPTSGNHALIEAVHQAFSQHYPLTLSPDILWLTLSQGAALHIQNHAEELRHLFVDHSGKRELTVTISQKTPQGWQHAVQAWTEQIRGHVGDATADVFECSFSTSTEISRTASQIVMMDGFREYFDYTAICICGIPEIHLTGSVEDWVKLKQKVLRLDHWGLSWWTRHLLPLCDQWILTARGRPNQGFWRNMYKPERFYGPEKITGWLKLLFPYLQNLQNPDQYTHKNPCLEGTFQGFATGSTLSPKDVPDGISRVPFKLRELHQEQTLQLLAGCLGVTQDSKTLHIEPFIGWAMSHLSPLARGNSAQGLKRTMDLQVLRTLGVHPSVLEGMGWLEDVTVIGSRTEWFFLLGDFQDCGGWVEVGKGKQGRILLHKSTGQVKLANPEGEVFELNQSLMHFQRCVMVLEEDFFDVRLPEETSVHWKSHSSRIGDFLKNSDPTAFENPSSFWNGVLERIAQGKI